MLALHAVAKRGGAERGTVPPRSTPAARQRRLGSELRRLREESGTSVRHAAGLLGVDRTRIPNIESGQTEAHARAVFGVADPPLAEPELQDRLALRMARRQVFARERPPLYEAVVHEAALRMRFGGPGVVREQLEHVLAQSERERTTILVIPFSAGGFPGSGQSFTYAAAALNRLDTVQLDSSHGAALIDSGPTLTRYRGLLERLRALALPEAASRDFIRTVVRDL
ncbi:hypothetical protein ADK97_12985 [Streptomyces sp. H021]|nr:hypothetical protein ADK97_12985 [Streptomyces sp. H021]